MTFLWLHGGAYSYSDKIVDMYCYSLNQRFCRVITLQGSCLEAMAANTLGLSEVDDFLRGINSILYCICSLLWTGIFPGHRNILSM